MDVESVRPRGSFALETFLVDRRFPTLAEKLRPDELAIANLSRLSGVLDRLVDQFPGPWCVSSGFRDAQLNGALRKEGLLASMDSLHLYGCAVDLTIDNPEFDLEAPFEWLKVESRRDLPVHEAILYPAKRLLHVAVKIPRLSTSRRFLTRL
jgi:hypothetical protein